MTMESLPPEKSSTGRSNWAATSRMIKMASDSSCCRCERTYEFIVTFFHTPSGLRGCLCSRMSESPEGRQTIRNGSADGIEAQYSIIIAAPSTRGHGLSILYRCHPRCPACMQSAFGFLPPAPAASPRVLTRSDRRRAWPAADARIAAIVQRVIGNIMLVHVGSHLGAGPGDQRIDLDKSELWIGFDDGRCGTIRGLVTTDRRHPGCKAL